MTLYPVSLLFILIWLRVSLKDPDRGVSVALAALPFGMFAALAVGGLSVLMAHFLVLLCCGVFAIRWASGAIGRLHVPRAGILLLLFGLYSLFSAIILVRLFAGTFLVFPLSFDLKGTAVSIYFFSTMKPLAPSNSNIAQAGYILISIAFFLVMVNSLRRRGAEIIESGLVWAAGVNIALGAVDLVGLDNALSIIRTADYALNNEHALLGFARVIGGFPEASEFGAFSAAMFAYFATSFLISRRRGHGALALGSFTCALLSFSSTGYAALFAAAIMLALHARHFAVRGISWNIAHGMAVLLALALVGLSAALIATPFLETFMGLIDRLFFDKANSTSGLERAAWARSGLNAFVQSWGLGAGAGSLRANGLVAVLLGSVGLPGTLAFVAYLWSALGPFRAFGNVRAACFFYSARVAAITYLAAKLVSGTTPDPTLFLVAVTAIAAVAREVHLKRAARARHGTVLA
ncbi:hypothetical protein [Marimonas lutisalis]|uniref:hypothetical protein n=1 Tax=Marimonas lutisalis TaxID=2545756 RepID=UPI0010F80515|nr:hypothetical protein [Marimonas lutisalis]